MTYQYLRDMAMMLEGCSTGNIDIIDWGDEKKFFFLSEPACFIFPRYEQLREDKADVVAYLKRTLQQRTDQVSQSRDFTFYEPWPSHDLQQPRNLPVITLYL